MRWLLGLLLCCATPAAATIDAWPALHDVVGVAPDDVLNIRSDPSAASAIIGTLAHDAEGIEVIRPSEDFDWGLVNTGEGTGWVSLRYVVPQPGQWFGQIPRVRGCFGTEPFWSLDFSREVPTYSEPDHEEVLTLGHEMMSLNRRDRAAFLMSGDAGPAQLIVTYVACTDGMSDREYGLTADFLRQTGEGPALVSGCCSLAGR
ncbi:peptide-binding protein [Ovoidimarina sediminis]|uniref:peptide-binding protein n=1 Tax=Ovoidimarina sediminis TaxID=3079856 RepID=UPI00290F9BB7|nr:peptide-binding protein [Rhodophyticola sp. MJ-SS7]MDU8942403.1 peptide-binding protein [Rhodophyticola sp. MJ-SS7]